MYQINRKVRIAGTGSFAPPRVVSNTELAARVDTSDEWIATNLGIRERRVVDEGVFTSDIGAEAARKALDHAGIKPNDVDIIVVATATPDRKAPSTACLVQEKLGITNSCPAFDLNAVCSGFLYGMSVASQFLESGACINALVIGADTFSRITDWNRRDCVFFGDGAGAAVLQRTPTRDGFLCFELCADGGGRDAFTVHPHDTYFTMDSKQVYSMATSVLPAALQELLRRHDLKTSDVNMLIPHQPSIRSLTRIAELLSMPTNKIAVNIDRYANTAGATVPLLLDEVVRSGQVKEGDLVAFAAVGSGWTWGASLYRWTSVGSSPA